MRRDASVEAVGELSVVVEFQAIRTFESWLCHLRNEPA